MTATPPPNRPVRCQMPRYRCCFLSEDGQVARVEELNSDDDDDAHRDAVHLLSRIGRFSGYELWRDGRKVDEFKSAIPPDPRTSEMEAVLCGLAPVDELAYRYLLRDHFSHYKRDLVWKARIAELEERLDGAGRARARALAADLTWTLADKL
jgi:hypothetical protein